MIVYEQHFEHLKKQTQTICKYVASENPFFRINCWHSDGISRTWHIMICAAAYDYCSCALLCYLPLSIFILSLLFHWSSTLNEFFMLVSLFFFVLVWKRTFFFGKLHKNINGFSSRTEILRRICDEFLLKQHWNCGTTVYEGLISWNRSHNSVYCAFKHADSFKCV